MTKTQQLNGKTIRVHQQPGRRWFATVEQNGHVIAETAVFGSAHTALLAGEAVAAPTATMLVDYGSGQPIRRATREEFDASREMAERDGGRGVIEVDQRRCYVDGETYSAT